MRRRWTDVDARVALRDASGVVRDASAVLRDARPACRDARPLVRVVALALAVLAGLALAGTAVAHSGTLRGATRESLSIPTWLFLATGGGAVGASFLLASFATDRAFVRSLHEWGRSLDPGAARRVARGLGRLVGLVGLAAVLVVGLAVPAEGVRNLAILLVWVGWWGAFVASTYLLGNAWPAVNPFRTLAAALPTLDRPYPERLGAWPAVAGLLALVWIEVVSPLADDPRLLGGVVAGYGLLTVAGAVVFGPATWFTRADPVARALALYGAVAPVNRAEDGLRVRLPGAALRDLRLGHEPGAVAFVVGVLFVTTYDGFVATDLWAGAVRAAVGAGVPPLVAYGAAYLVGFALSYAVFRAAARSARRTANTYLTGREMARRFAPPLLAIAAGYHLAHNVGAVLTLAPALAVVAVAPLSPPLNPPTLVALPGWIGGVEIASVLLGHLLAVWVAHAVAFDLFPGRLQAIRSQYGVTAAMVLYTMTSLWIVSRPYAAPPFL